MDLREDDEMVAMRGLTYIVSIVIIVLSSLE